MKISVNYARKPLLLYQEVVKWTNEKRKSGSVNADYKKRDEWSDL